MNNMVRQPAFAVTPDRDSILAGSPTINTGNGVFIHVGWNPKAFISSFLDLRWNETTLGGLQPANDTKYRLIDKLLYSYPLTGAGYPVTHSEGGYPFTAWNDFAHLCGDHYNDSDCLSLSYGLTSSFAPFSAPTSSPSAIPEAFVPLTVPASTPETGTPAQSTFCAGPASMYSLNFTCINGEWHRFGNWEVAGEVQFLSGSAPIVVDGNISFATGGSIRLTDRGSSLLIVGCITANVDNVYLDYTDGWPKLEGWYQNAITQKESCVLSTASIPFTLLQPKSCIDAKATPTLHTSNGLVVHFVLNSAKCNLIIGLSVLGGCAALLLCLGLVYCCVTRKKTESNPYSSLSGSVEEYITYGAPDLNSTS